MSQYYALPTPIQLNPREEKKDIIERVSSIFDEKQLSEPFVSNGNPNFCEDLDDNSDGEDEIKSSPMNELKGTEVDDGTLCPVCKEILKSPLVTQCGHLICEKCTIDHEKELKKCPVCRTHIHSSSFYRCYPIGKLIEKIHKIPVERYTLDYKTSPTLYAASEMLKLSRAKYDQKFNELMEKILNHVKQLANTGKKSMTICIIKDSEFSEYYVKMSRTLKKLGYHVFAIDQERNSDFSIIISWEEDYTKSKTLQYFYLRASDVPFSECRSEIRHTSRVPQYIPQQIPQQTRYDNIY